MTATKKKWLIISWMYNGFIDGNYGKMLQEIEGTYEEAAQEARQYIPNFSPVGVVGVIE
jgi:hypothetical protein